MDLRKLVRPEEGLVSRRIFTDEDIFQQELEKIFGRCWLYLGHASQLPREGDFFTTYMGADSVVVTRSGNGIRAFLNSCTHRGMKICRTDNGNAKSFTCPYHSWCFSTDGDLISVPGMREAYFNELDKSKWGLKEVAQLDTFGGMIFATWDPNASSLRDYFQGMEVYLDRMVNRVEGGMEMLGGVQKWDIGCNWKTIAENFLSDAYHVPSTHASVVDIGFRAPPKLKGYQISPGGGHGFGSEMGGTGTGAATSSEYAKSLENLRKDLDSNPANQFIPLGHGTVFPNLSFLDNMKFRLVRVSHPRSPWITESHTMCFVDKAMPDDLRQAVRRDFILSFGPSGMFEVEDGEVWGELTESMRGWVSRNQDFNYQMGLNRHKSVKEDFNVDLPGQSGFYWSELVHRNFYARWRDQMEG